MGDPVGLSKACGQARTDDQHVSESDPGPSTGRHFHSSGGGAGVAVVEEPLQDSELIHNEPVGLDMAERMLAILDRRMQAAFERTGLGWLRGQIRGLGDVSLVNLLALTGDLRRFDDARCLPKPAGSNPTERSSGQSHAPGGIHRRGRKALRLLAYQAAVCLVLHHPDFRQRFLALIRREHHRLEKRQA